MKIELWLRNGTLLCVRHGFLGCWMKSRELINLVKFFLRRNFKILKQIYYQFKKHKLCIYSWKTYLFDIFTLKFVEYRVSQEQLYFFKVTLLLQKWSDFENFFISKSAMNWLLCVYCLWQFHLIYITALAA